MSNWYYAENEEQKGPINEAELKEKFAQATLPPDTLVWAKGMAGWVEAHTLPKFQFTAPPAPAADPVPPLPTKSAESATPAQPVASATAPAGQKVQAPAKREAAPEAHDDHTYDELGDIIKKPPVLEVSQEDFEKNKILAIMSYIYVLFVVTLVVGTKSPYARYHGAQGLTLFFVTTLYWLFVVSLWFVLANLIPDFIFYLAMFAPPITLAVIGVMNAYQGKAQPLPVIGGFTLLR